ncbi:Uncharacterized protein PECH_008457 [Penicillium ucsense]|uniref:Uncharacterized protein n=1 Tax=Penicillium ucsense TaxID=2839758 RepID=A0A8J8W7D8_9EURO|nr:Uncharacterized protein PECM_003702 [Penicillium ucsense]KAF7734140.1 Uncharacterized protein PECH_008457 [Penicillium ucsense]
MASRNTPNEPGWPYNHLPVPDTDMDTSCPVRTFQLRLVEKMTSDEWECPEIAKLQAICTPEVTPENEQFVRTYHPGLRCHDYVFVSHPQYGPEVWLVYDRIDYITVAGRPCHTFPKNSGNLCPKGSVQSRPALGDNHLFHNYHINPRKILSPEQLDCLRDLFPTAIGVQVLVSGFLVVLMKSQSDIRAAYHQGLVSEVAGLALTFNDFSVQPKSGTWISGVELRGGSRPLNGQGCLGLRLQLVDGKSAVTTTTHGFMADLPPAKPDRIETPELEDLGELSRQNAPIDKEIWLKEEERRVSVALFPT